VVLLLHRPSYYDDYGKNDNRNQDGNPPAKPEDRSAECIIAKQRNGPTGTIPLVFRREFLRFEDSTEGAF
jgi:replicative DNA helicase